MAAQESNAAVGRMQHAATKPGKQPRRASRIHVVTGEGFAVWRDITLAVRAMTATQIRNVHLLLSTRQSW